MATYNYPFTAILTPSLTVTRTKLIDNLYDCPDIVPCGECGVCKYLMPFQTDDVFYYFIGFVADTVELWDTATDTFIMAANSWLSGAMLIVDFSILPPSLTCFYIKLKRGLEECCFEFSFQRVEPQTPNGTCVDDTLLIQSTYPFKDCLGNNYQAGFSNQMRVWARLRRMTNETEVKEDDNDRVFEEKINDVYSFKTTKLLPSESYTQRLLETVLRGFDLTITTPDRIYEFRKFTESISNAAESFEDWQIDVELKTYRCKLRYYCDL